MRRYVAVLILMLCATVAHAKDKPTPPDYPIKVHISSSHMLLDLRNGNVTYANATLDGKKVELAGMLLIQSQWTVIIPGDYLARLTKDVHNTGSTAIHWEYDVLLPDGTVWHCVVSGVSE